MSRLPVIAALALLLLPASAHAAYAPPTTTQCDANGRCFTPQPGDRYTLAVQSAEGKGWGFLHTGTGSHSLRGTGCTYVYKSRDQWMEYGSPKSMDICVYVGGEYVTHTVDRYLFSDLPESDYQFFLPEIRLIYTEYQSGGEVVGGLTHVEMKGIGLSPYCERYTSTIDYKVAVAGAPASVVAACGLSTEPVDPVTVPDPTPPAPVVKPQDQSIAIPRSAARCGIVGKVVVRSTRVSCRPARSIIARYARTLRSPRGWSCRAVVTDAGRRASCTRKAVARSTSRATVYGVWRPSRR